MLLVLSSLSLLVLSAAQRWNPDFSQMPEGNYYKQVYENFMRDIDSGYQQQKEYLMQQPGYMESNKQYRQGLMETYQQSNPRADEFGNLMAGDANAPVFLTCNGQGCNARG